MEYRRAATETPGVIERIASEHQLIVDALRAGDPDAAATAMSEHLRSIHQTTVQAMQQAAPARPGRVRGG